MKLVFSAALWILYSCLEAQSWENGAAAPLGPQASGASSKDLTFLDLHGLQEEEVRGAKARFSFTLEFLGFCIPQWEKAPSTAPVNLVRVQLECGRTAVFYPPTPKLGG